MRWFALPLLLVACTQPAPPAPRVRVAEPVVQPAPVVTTHLVEGGQLLVMLITTKDEFGLSETQKCFVWREPGSASTMSCPAAPSSVELVP